MKRNPQCSFALMLVCVLFLPVWSPSLYAQAHDTSPAPYVAIQIEVRELSEAGKLLRDASATLAKSLENAAQNLDELSPEQLRELNALTQSLTALSTQTEQLTQTLPETLTNARQPAQTLIEHAIDTIETQAISPLKQSLHDTLRWVFIAVGLLISIILVVLIWCVIKLGRLGHSLKDLAGAYRIVPLEDYQRLERQRD